MRNERPHLSFHGATAVFLALILCGAAPILDAQEEDAQPSENNEAAEATDTQT